MLFETNVIKVIQRTPDVMSFRFEKPHGFNYLAGQYVVLTLGNNSNQMKKPFTLSSSPTEEFLEITKKLTGHPFSNALTELKSGDTVVINGPYGVFTFQEEYTNISMLSGGIGITPLRSMIKYSIDKKINTDIVLIYSNRYETDIAFRDELELIQSKQPNIIIINTITRPEFSWKGVTRRIDTDDQEISSRLQKPYIFYMRPNGNGKFNNISFKRPGNSRGTDKKRNYYLVITDFIFFNSILLKSVYF